MEYLNGFNELNNILDELAILCEEFLIDKGFKVFSQTTTYGDEVLPHKTITTRAGWLDW